MSLKPLEDRIVVQPNEAEQTTASGLVIPDTAKEKPQQGKVLAEAKGEVGEKLLCSSEIFAFELDETDDDVRNLHTGVVDVVLHADFVARLVAVGAEKPLEGVAEDGVA